MEPQDVLVIDDNTRVSNVTPLLAHWLGHNTTRPKGQPLALVVPRNQMVQWTGVLKGYVRRVRVYPLNERLPPGVVRAARKAVIVGSGYTLEKLAQQFSSDQLLRIPDIGAWYDEPGHFNQLDRRPTTADPSPPA